jgi:hypothetical protein
MENIIHEFYELVSDRTGQTKDSLKLENDIKNLVVRCDMERISKDKEYLETVLTDAASLGQDNGFLTGVTSSIKLIFFCLTKEN